MKNSLGTITLEDKYEIIGNIEDEYNYSEENIRKMLQDIGFKPRNLSESDIVTAIRRGNGDEYRAMILIKEQRPSDNSHKVTPYTIEVKAMELKK